MTWPVAANISLLFTELPLLERIPAAKLAGFDGVEIQFPYEVTPEALSAALASSGMPLALINVPAGDLMTGGPGLAGVPTREDEFGEALDQALEYVSKLESISRPSRINVLPGKMVANFERYESLATLATNLHRAAQAFDSCGVGVTTEAINRYDMPGFLVSTSQELAELLIQANHANLSAQLDLYHMARMDEPLDEAIGQLAGRIGHVQFADVPNRGEPGSDGFDFAAALDALQRHGYSGWLSAEYRPAVSTPESLDWLKGWRAAGWVRPLVHSAAPRR